MAGTPCLLLGTNLTCGRQVHNQWLSVLSGRVLSNRIARLQCAGTCEYAFITSFLLGMSGFTIVTCFPISVPRMFELSGVNNTAQRFLRGSDIAACSTRMFIVTRAIYQQISANHCGVPLVKWQVSINTSNTVPLCYFRSAEDWSKSSIIWAVIDSKIRTPHECTVQCWNFLPVYTIITFYMMHVNVICI